MSHTPPRWGKRCMPMISAWSREGGNQDPWTSGAIASAAYPSAQRAYYFPVEISCAVTVYKLWWANGATVGTDNVQVAVYLADGTDKGPGTRVIAGTSTLSAGSNAVQYDDITNAALGPGKYWIGHWCSGTTATFLRVGNRVSPLYDEDSLAGGLPSTATPSSPASAWLPLVGLQVRSAP